MQTPGVIFLSDFAERETNMCDIDKMVDGFGRFRDRYFAGSDKLFEPLKQGQEPKVLVIGCSDSRVDPALLFDSDPGELFVVRNVANLVPPYQDDHGTHGVSAALEFAVKELKVNHIVVLGHSQCGGIKALISGAGGEFISQWMQIAEEVVHAAPDAGDSRSDEEVSRVEQASVIHSLRNLQSFPFVRKRMENDGLQIHGWYFDLAGGRLLSYDSSTDTFSSISH